MSKVIHTEELISSFIEKIQKDYPTLTKKDLDLVCRAEFKLVKEIINSGSLEEVRLQYLFTLRVSPQRVIKQLTFMRKHHKDIRQEALNKYVTLLLDYVNKNQKKFKKYEDKISKLTEYSKEEIKGRTYLDNGYKCNPS